MAPLFPVFRHHLGDHGVSLRALEHCRVVGKVQAVAALFLALLKAVGLARTADAATLAGHHLDKVIELLALVDFL